jgi:hypothetical protein
VINTTEKQFSCPVKSKVLIYSDDASIVGEI